MKIMCDVHLYVDVGQVETSRGAADVDLPVQGSI